MSTLSFTKPACDAGRPTSGKSAAPVDDLLSRSRQTYGRVKGGLDFILALTLLLLTAPLTLLAMLLVKLTSRGPALYSQMRLGRYGQPFTIYKVRTMRHDCESLTGPRWATVSDSRVTAVGRWLRRTHLDELPQLWNVLRGDMSLIGPRPERPEFAPKLEQAVPHYRKRLQVRPGVTGLAQVQLPPDSDLDSVLIKTAYDLHYVGHISLQLDVRIAWATLFKVSGTSFSRMQQMFRFPARHEIESHYRALSPPPALATCQLPSNTASDPAAETATDIASDIESADSLPARG